MNIIPIKYSSIVANRRGGWGNRKKRINVGDILKTAVETINVLAPPAAALIPVFAAAAAAGK